MASILKNITPTEISSIVSNLPESLQTSEELNYNYH